MQNFVFQNKTKVYFGRAKEAIMAKKACGGDVLHGFTDLTPDDVEKIYRMCL